MRAILCNTWGGTEVLKLTDAPIPQPNENQVLIKVKATSANYADLVMINGNYQTKPSFPFGPGIECSGIVSAIGKKVNNVKIGQNVLAKVKHSGFAEYTIAEADLTFPFPKKMSWEEAGSFFVSYVSSYAAIKWQGELKENQTILVLGASGGTGVTALQIGKALGAKVIGSASNEKKLKTVKMQGATHTVNYKTEDLKLRINQITSGSGVDVVFDPVGGNLFDKALSSLGWGGKYLIFGFVGGIPNIPANRLLVKHRSAIGCSLRYFENFEPEKLIKGVQKLFKLYDLGKLKPLISKIYKLENAKEALDDLEKRKAIGRIIIKI
tara:strand:- start:719 stop:1690 length:972 start_codon:yes stop_codon:yes gene_type:complete